MIHTETDYIDLTPELKGRLDGFYEEHKNDPLGDIATTLLFEDDRVRIWEMKLEPGEASAKHHHDNDFYLVIMQGDLIAGVTPEDSEVENFAARLPKEGNTVPIAKGGTEWAYNTGKETFREILIELKDS
jgi:mannose-6-phosphate isomerase-like protein (cupin superfamily)